MNGALIFFKVGDKGYVHMQPFPFGEQKQSKEWIPLREHPKSGHLARLRGQGPQTEGVG